MIVCHTATRWALDHLLKGRDRADLVGSRFQWREAWPYQLPDRWRPRPKSQLLVDFLPADLDLVAIRIKDLETDVLQFVGHLNNLKPAFSILFRMALTSLALATPNPKCENSCCCDAVLAGCKASENP